MKAPAMTQARRGGTAGGTCGSGCDGRFGSTLHRCNEPIAFAWNRRDICGTRIHIAENLAQLGHGLINGRRANDHVSPHLREQAIHADDRAGGIRQAQEQSHRSRLEFLSLGTPRNAIQRGMNGPLADLQRTARFLGRHSDNPPAGEYKACVTAQRHCNRGAGHAMWQGQAMGRWSKSFSALPNLRFRKTRSR